MDTYARSRVPLKLMLVLILAMAVNFGIVTGLQAALSYRFPLDVDEAALGRMDARYEGCTILAFDGYEQSPRNPYRFYLIQTPEGQLELVTVRNHYLLDRCKLVKKGCKALAPEDTSAQVFTGSVRFYLTIQANGDQPKTLDVEGSVGDPSGKANHYLLPLFLCIPEYIGYVLLFKRHEIT